jgi:probable HAF family extracellular repeat protein
MRGLGNLPDYNSVGLEFGISADGSVIVGTSDSPARYEAFRWTSMAGMAGLGEFPVGVISQSAYDTSADGAIIVGNIRLVSGHSAYRWDSAEGTVDLGGLTAFGVSADGTVVVGGEEGSGGAFYWTKAGGRRNLANMLIADFGLNLNGWRLLEATAISDDGLTIVGEGINPEGHFEGWRAHLGAIPEPAPAIVLGLFAAILLAICSLKRTQKRFRE